MTRIYDFTVIGVINIIAFTIHYIGITLFQPGSALWVVATDGTGNVNGQQHAQLWFEIGAVWVPVLAIAGIWAWGLIREYRRQTVTRQRRPV